MDRRRAEQVLRASAESVDWPEPSGGLPVRVTGQIEAQAGMIRPVWRRLATAAAIVVVLVGVLALSPTARQAAADLFSEAGIRIGFIQEPSPAAGAALELGQEVELGRIGQSVDFVVSVPAGEDPGAPDAVYLSDGRISMVWFGTPSLPAAGDSDIGLLLAQSQSNNGSELASKTLGSETTVRNTVVGGVRAVWIEGAPHTITLLDVEGNPIPVTTRLAANVLLWDAGGVDYRLETTSDLAAARAIAEALRPLEAGT